MKRKILIVDDNAINRRMLTRILGEDYEVLEAKNGEEALLEMHRAYKYLSAVLLDLVMPVMDGYAVLERVRKNPALSQVPILVMTANTDADAEMRALTLGANDFITKPYKPDIVLRRLYNTIQLRETAATVNALQRDKLTGLYVREAFLQKASDLIRSREPGHYVMACFDIDGFKIINDQYGIEKGDDVLRRVAHIFKNGFTGMGGLAGRIAADNFAALYPVEMLESEALRTIRADAAALDGSIPPIVFSIGRYVVTDQSLPVGAMYDRAAIAALSVKGRFDTHIAFYDESMYESLLYEQAIVNDMKPALARDEFETWFQPQYNHSSGALIGAEALVRWRHPEKGLLSPARFIPMFERNGFIYELDKFVWECACAFLRQQIDLGHQPLPISVNVSRCDVLRSDLIDTIMGLIERYDVPIELLRLEITESAFAQSTEQIIRVAKELIDRGFTLEIDDFGSGYSSLNTLKDVPAQILKLDMRFLENSGDTDRGGNILESVVRMAKWLNMSTIAEGVETRQQADYLRSIGCSYVQGYLYAKPMPKADYARLAARGGEDRLTTLETVENLDNNAFWDPESMDTLIFNSYVGGACIFEYHNGHIEMLRATEKYGLVISGGRLRVEDVLKLDWSQHLDCEDHRLVEEAVRRSIETHDEVTNEYVFRNLPNCPEETYLRSTLRVIASAGERYLVYCTSENITAQMEASRREERVALQMRVIMQNMEGGVSAVTIQEDNVRTIFANDRFFSIFGYTREQFMSESIQILDLMHPLDRERVKAAFRETEQTHGKKTLEYRIIRRGGEIAQLRMHVSLIRLDGVDEPVFLSVASDVTTEKQAEERLRETAEQLHFLNDVAGDLLAPQDDMATCIARVLEKMRVYFGGEGAFLYEYSPQDGAWIRTYESPASAGDGAPHQSIPADVAKRWLGAFERARVMRVDGTNASDDKHDGRRAVLHALGARSALAVSLRADGRIEGVMGVVDPTQRTADYDDLAALGDYMTAILARRDLTSRIESDRHQLLALMNDTPGGFVRMRVLPEGALSTEYVNERFCDMRGLTREEILARGVKDSMESVHPDDRDAVEEKVRQLLNSGGNEAHGALLRLRYADGTYFPVNVTGRVTQDEAGGVFINAYYAEITQEEQQALSLRDTLQYVLGAIMRYSTDLVFAKDRAFRYICCSPAFVKFTRQNSEADVIGKTDYDFFTKEEADHFRADDEKLLRDGTPLVDYLEQIPSDDGIRHYCNTSKYILHDATGEVIGLYGIGRDVTEHRMSFEQLKLLTDSIIGGVATYVASKAGVRILYVNDGFCNMLGYSRAEYESICQSSVLSLTLEEDVPRLRAQIRELLEHGTPIDCTYRVRCKDGSVKWVTGRGKVYEKHGEVSYVNMVLFDATDVKAAAEQTRIHEQEMRFAMAQMGKMICEYDPNTKTLTMPGTYAALYGVPSEVANVPERVIRTNSIEESFIPTYLAFYDAIQRGEKTGRAEYMNRRADGGCYWESAEFFTIFDAAGKPAKTIIAVEDTTRRHLQYELEHSRPMLGEKDLIGRALIDLTNGAKALEYFDGKGEPVLAETRLAIYGGERTLEKLIPDADEREAYRVLHDVEMLLKAYKAGETEHTIEYRRRLASGDIVWARNLLKLTPAPDGSGILMFEYCYSIDEEKTQQQINRSLIADNYDYILRINGRTGGYVMSRNPDRNFVMPSLRGDDADAMFLGRIKALVHPDDRANARGNMRVADMKRNLASCSRYVFTYRELQQDGSVCHKKITQYYLDRARDLIIVTREDVTALVREEMRKNEILEAALTAANEESRVKERVAASRLNAIMSNVGGGVCALTIVDGKSTFLFLNDAFLAMYDMTREQFERECPNGVRDLIHPDDRVKLNEAIEKTAAEGSAQVEFRAYRRDGTMIWVRNIGSTCAMEGVLEPVYLVVSSDITAERMAADALRMSEAMYRIAAAAGGRVISRYDIKNDIYSHNDPTLFALGFGEAVHDLPHALVEMGAIAQDCVADYLTFFDKLKRGEKAPSTITAIRMPSGEYRWFRREGTAFVDSDGQPSQAIIVITDVTEEREKEAVYRKWRQSLGQRQKEDYTLFQCNLSKDTSFDSVEGGLLDVTFSSEKRTFDERTKEYVRKYVFPEDRESYRSFLKADTLLANYYRGTRQKTLEYRELRHDGSIRWLRLTAELVEYPNSTDIEAYLLYEDIDQRKRAELANKARAERDPLTGVLNRNAFAQTVERLIAGPDPVDSFALMMLDIDSFKLINDTFGHAVGDRVLMDMAESLRGALRQGDVLGRLGGDEFLVCLPNIASDATAERKAGQICAMLQRTLSADVRSSVSVGVAIYPRDGRDYETLYRKMDAALYKVKGSGKNNYALYRNGWETGATTVAEETARTAVESGKRRMLLACDDPLSLQMLERLFAEEYEIEKARGGAEALACQSEGSARFAVVLLDLATPEMNGFAVLERMRADVRLRQVPVVVIGAADEREKRPNSARYGVAECATKPIDPERIRLCVRSVIDRVENERLCAQNDRLLRSNAEIVRYRAALDSLGVTLMEYEPSSGRFRYDPSIANRLTGTFDARAFWEILKADQVASDADADAVKRLIQDAAAGDGGSVIVRLQTPQGIGRMFRVRAKKSLPATEQPARVAISVSAMDADGQTENG